MTTRGAWLTEAGIAHLRFLWARGDSIAAIARDFRVSKGAVSGKVGRLELENRPSPIKRREGGPVVALPSQSERLAASALAPLESDLAKPRAAAVRPPWAAPAVVAPAPRPVIAPPVPVPPRPVVRQRVGQCCWPIGEPGTEAFRFCASVAVERLPYCDEHSAKAYTGWRQRQAAGEPAHAGGEG